MEELDNEVKANGGVADGMIIEGGSGDGESSFIKGVDFDGEGMTLEVVSMQKFTPNETKYGANHTYGAGGKIEKENWFVKNGLLEEGDSWKYSFKKGDTEQSFDNSSVGFYFAFTKLNPKAGEKISIKRNKITDTKVEWTVEKV